MLFNSWSFILFFLAVLPVYYSLSHRWQNRFLLVASYVFYGMWDWRFTGLLAVSTIVDYTVARAIAATDDDRAKWRLLLVSLFTNLGILGFFKYFNFFFDSTVTLLESVGMRPDPWTLRVILPVGISFYTFQTLAYTIDVYRGRQKPTRNFVAFGVYVAYFPQLVAGPIERAARLLPQIERPRRVRSEDWSTGAQLILWGYLKKVAVADSLAVYVTMTFDNTAQLTAPYLWLGIYCFALQIYCDFSGYSDIARGVSRLFGIDLMENFRQPYLSANITEFWRRWHISLSSWLRDYLYIPLGGNRKGTLKRYRNLFVTMLLGGLWHGAGWNFVVWGGMHGALLAAHRMVVGERRAAHSAKPTSLVGWFVFVAKVALTFNIVCIAWVFFRAENIQVAWNYLGAMFEIRELFSLSLSNEVLVGRIGGVTVALAFYALVVLAMDASCWRSGQELPCTARTPWWLRGCAYAAGILIIALVRESNVEQFIYFQF